MSLYKNMWDTSEAVVLCSILEPIVAEFDCHVALTGGLLYKAGPRKDCDIVIYRRGRYKDEKELPEFNQTALIDAIEKVLTIHDVYTRVTKASYNDKAVDLIFVNSFGEQGVEGDST